MCLEPCSVIHSRLVFASVVVAVCRLLDASRWIGGGFMHSSLDMFVSIVKNHKKVKTYLYGLKTHWSQALVPSRPAMPYWWNGPVIVVPRWWRGTLPVVWFVVDSLHVGRPSCCRPWLFFCCHHIVVPRWWRGMLVWLVVDNLRAVLCIHSSLDMPVFVSIVKNY